MLDSLSPNVKNIYMHTGNILNLNEVKKKAGQNPTDELIESLKITLSKGDVKAVEEDSVKIQRLDDDTQTGITSEDRKGLKIGIKVFVSSPKKETLCEALETMFLALNVDFVDSLVLAYPSKAESTTLLPELQEMWTVLEDYTERQKLYTIGVSDIDTDIFVALHNWAKIKPSIIQINLASCCVVPPALQEFTKQNDIQLLTHSDPFGNYGEEREILPKSSLNSVFDFTGQGETTSLELSWALRFQVHVKCRGVLASKGYVVCIQRS
ncbi:glutamate--cysteine ligase regulatory subunit isoform X1 [Schistocerca gregaria]|uniref:glutamate--cysteine ligase regulatory subunit isoform X1 n=1 Tax=Schistocerca gregaria TaxID=7010 RepID=UPI00211E7F40|nr:glutamate--cysteine ligase regulatory subunit isoform X1 [Schistocerca gregaria]